MTGLDEERLAAQMKEIRKINRRMKDIRILAGAEVRSFSGAWARVYAGAAGS